MYGSLPTFEMPPLARTYTSESCMSSCPTMDARNYNLKDFVAEVEEQASLLNSGSEQ